MNRPLPEKTPVLVAGAGPAGLAAAAELARHGVDCVVIEPRAEVSHDRPRAKTTSVRTMEHLRRWGVADALRDAAPLAPSWSQRVTFCETLTGARVTDIDGVFGLSPDGDPRFAEGGQQVPQPIVEEVLREHLRSQPGVDLRFGCRVVGVEPGVDEVVVLVEDDAGERTSLRARHVLGCDGANSAVRRAIGVKLVGTSDARPNFNVVFRAPGLRTPLGPAVQYWVVGTERPGLIGRLDLNDTWWAILPGVEEHDGSAHTVELLHGLIGEDVELEVLSTDTWTARMLVAERFQYARVYLVGESAHLNPPWGGHGFNTCVGDAVNIAWKIAAVEQGWAGDGLLSSYDPERRDVVEQTVASATHNMQTLAGDLATDADAIRAAKMTEFHSLGLVLGYTYAGSPAVQPTSSPAPITGPTAVSSYVPTTDPGSRLPHHWLTDGSSLYDVLGRGMTLLGPLSERQPEVEYVQSLARDLGIPLTVLSMPSDYSWSHEFLLVRPDQHIAWRTDDPSTIDLRQVLAIPYSHSSNGAADDGDALVAVAASHS